MSQRPTALSSQSAVVMLLIAARGQSSDTIKLVDIAELSFDIIKTMKQ